MAALSEPDPAFEALAQRYLGLPDVERGTGFGTSPGLRVGGRIFAMLPRDRLVVKLPAERCAAIVAAGEGALLTNGRRTMREWVEVETADPVAWAALADEALVFVRG